MGPSSRIEVGGEHQNRTKVVAGLAAARFGAVARRELLASGISAEQVRGWLRRGLLHRRYPSVYAWGRADLGTEGELACALLYAGPGAALSGLSALWWLGLLGRRPDRISLDAPGARVSHADIAIRHPREIDRRTHRGLPVVALSQALLAAAPHLRHDTMRLVLARAEYECLLSLPELESALGPGRPGTRAVRVALGAHLAQLARCASGLEREFVLLCESGGSSSRSRTCGSVAFGPTCSGARRCW